MPLQGEYEPAAAGPVRDQVEEYERSGGRSGTMMGGAPTIIITSLGAVSGKVRKHPVMRVEHEGVYAAVASKRGAPTHPAWHGNLLKHPLIEVQDGPSKGDFIARIASGEERETWWERAVEAWPSYVEYQAETDRQIPVFVLEPAN